MKPKKSLTPFQIATLADKRISSSDLIVVISYAPKSFVVYPQGASIDKAQRDYPGRPIMFYSKILQHWITIPENEA